MLRGVVLSVWRSGPVRFLREAGLVFDLAALAGSSVLAGAIVGAVNLWTEVGIVPQVCLAGGVGLFVISVVVFILDRWHRPRRGWTSNSRLQMKSEPFGHGLIMAIRGQETVRDLECRVSGPDGLRFKSVDRMLATNDESDRAGFHFPGEFTPQVEPYPPPGRYIVRWSGLVSIEDERNPFNEERLPLARETFRIDQFGGVHTKRRDRNLQV